MSKDMPKLSRRTQKALERKKKLIERYINEGLSPEEASKKADVEMRDNPRGDWRAG